MCLSVVGEMKREIEVKEKRHGILVGQMPPLHPRLIPTTVVNLVAMNR